MKYIGKLIELGCFSRKNVIKAIGSEKAARRKSHTISKLNKTKIGEREAQKGRAQCQQSKNCLKE